MSEPCQQEMERVRVAPGVWFLGPIRVGYRLTAILAWTLACYGVQRILNPLALVSKPAWSAVRKAISRTWTKGFPPILGTRVTVHGTPPSSPFCLVANHPSWLDYFVVNSQLDGLGIVEAPAEKIPIIGFLMMGLRPILVHRVKEATARVNDLMVEAIEAGNSVMLAPGGSKTTVRPGSGVDMFRGGLLESAVRTGTPVHYVAISYRTPPGYPPPTKSMLFGPNPHSRTSDGRIPESELEAWGPERSFLWYFVCFLTLPWHEVILRHGDAPIPAGTDRIALANQLHDAVERIFTPMD